MKQFSEEENNLKCKFKNKKNWWEIKLKLEMKTHLFCLKHLAKKKYFFECKWKSKACFCRDDLICYLLTSPFNLIFFLLFIAFITYSNTCWIIFSRSNNHFSLGWARLSTIPNSAENLLEKWKDPSLWFLMISILLFVRLFFLDVFCLFNKVW